MLAHLENINLSSHLKHFNDLQVLLSHSLHGYLLLSEKILLEAHLSKLALTDYRAINCIIVMHILNTDGFNNSLIPSVPLSFRAKE